GLALVGGGLFIFMALFVHIFVVDSELVTLVTFRGETAPAKAEVTAVEATNASENESAIYEVRYTFELDGRSYRGASYSLHAPLDPGDEVPVEYLRDDPVQSRIRGMRMRSFSASTGALLIVPLIGLLLFVAGVRGGIRNLRLLRRGKPGFGRLVDKRPTNTQVNGRTVYQLTFEFIVEPKAVPTAYRKRWQGWAETHRFKVKTHELERVTDEAEEPLVYDPEEPGQALLLDRLPRSVRIRDGQITGSGTWGFGLPIAIALVLASYVLRVV
ncbi:MAG: DUF3592 domain-containing protein, partial [Myxococcota bacterium]